MIGSKWSNDQLLNAMQGACKRRCAETANGHHLRGVSGVNRIDRRPCAKAWLRLMKSLLALATAISLLLIQTGARAADANLLTVDDFKAYYGATFTVTTDGKPADPVKGGGGGKLSMLTFMAMEPEVRVATLLIRDTDSPDAARKSAEAIRLEYGKAGIKIEDAPGVGDYAFFFGRQLVFSKGSESFVLAAPGLKKERDIVECHAAVTELAKKIAERAK